MKDKRVIFYSWQSDLPSRTNRGFIGDCLEKAANEIATQDNLSVEPVVDRDVQGAGGAVNIADEILRKIESCSVFVGDVSIINSESACRKTPNPNVLIELGYAAKCVGYGNVILVFNRAYGRPEELPFDLRFKKAVPYTLSDSDAEKSPQRTALVKALRTELKILLAQPNSVPLQAPASPLKVELGFEREKTVATRHDYRLTVGVRNASSEKIDDYHIDIEIPAEVCVAPASRDSYVKSRSTRDTAFFRITPALFEGALYPEDKRVIGNISYFVDDNVYHSHRSVFGKPVRVTAYAAGYSPLLVEKPLGELQVF